VFQKLLQREKIGGVGDLKTLAKTGGVQNEWGSIVFLQCFILSRNVVEMG